MKIEVKNKLSVASRVIFAIVLFLITLLCVVSLTVPAPQLYIEKNIARSDDIVATLDYSDIKYFNNCELNPDGEIVVTGYDPYILFSGCDTDIQTVKVVLNKRADTGFSTMLYYDDGSEFDEIKTQTEYVYPNDEYICYSILKSNNTNLRLDVDVDYSFSAIELHSEKAEVVKENIYVSIWEYAVAILVSLIIAVVFYLFDSFIYPVSEKIKEFYFKHYKGIFKGSLIILISFVLAIGIEAILGKYVFGISSTGSFFNGYRCIFVGLIVSSVAFLIMYIKNGAYSSEKLFVLLMLHVGVAMILCAPFGHICWDYDSHTKFVLEQSYIGEAYKTAADDAIITTKEFYFEKETALDNLNNIEYINSLGNEVVGINSGFSTIAHIPAGVCMAIGRFLGLPYVTYTIFGRIANLFIYTLICYFAMRKLKSGKMILATIAFFPTNVFLATNYSYDFWVTSFIMLGMAYFINEIQQPQKMPSALDAIIMCGAFILACIPKQIYMPVMILPFFMYKKWKSTKERKKYYIICALMFILMFVLLALRSYRSVTGGGDMRGGSEVNSMGQVSFILSEPLHYAKILLNFLKTYLSVGSMKNYITLFAYLNGGILEWVFIAMIIVTTLTDKCADDRFKGLWLVRIVSIVLFFGLSCLVATSMYVAFTAVGSETIQGCQGRYLTPALFPLLFVIASPGIVPKINRKIYDTVSLTILSSAVFYNIGFVFLSKLL